MHFSKALQGSKWGITMRLVSIESTYLWLCEFEEKMSNGIMEVCSRDVSIGSIRRNDS